MSVYKAIKTVGPGRPCGQKVSRKDDLREGLLTVTKGLLWIAVLVIALYGGRFV